MDRIRAIIKEEIETLWGQPIPKRGEKGYSPHKHNLEMLHTTSSHYKAAFMELDQSLDDIENIVGLTGIHAEKRLQEIQRIITMTRKEIEKLEREYRTDIKSIR
jgi:ribosomal protein L17